MSDVKVEELLRRLDELEAEVEKMGELTPQDMRIVAGLKRTLEKANVELKEDAERLQGMADDVLNYFKGKAQPVSEQVLAVKGGLRGAVKGFKDAYRAKAMEAKSKATKAAPEAKASEEE